MILFESRAAIERDGIRRLTAGMRDEFPKEMPTWLAQLEQTEDWTNLGRQMAYALTLSQPRVSIPTRFLKAPTQHGLESTEPKPSTADESVLADLKRRLQIAQAETRCESEYATQVQSEAESLRRKLEEHDQLANAQIAQLTQEITDLRRIVGAQQYRLNQSDEKITE